MSTVELSSLRADIERLGPWFHNLHLPDGTQTAPGHWLGDFPRMKWERIRGEIPEDLAGWRVLDIGCNAGFYTFELARRGARVTAIDYDERYLAQARWAADVYGLADRVEFRHRQVYDLAHDDETYDLVWFMGVFYHLRYPLLGLDTVARKVTRRLVFQTMTCPGEADADAPADLGLHERERLNDPGWPKMAFIEHRLANDPTNWWAPTAAGVRALLRSAGLKVVAEPDHEIFICEPAPADARPIPELLEAEWRSATGRSRKGE